MGKAAMKPAGVGDKVIITAGFLAGVRATVLDTRMESRPVRNAPGAYAATRLYTLELPHGGQTERTRDQISRYGQESSK